MAVAVIGAAWRRANACLCFVLRRHGEAAAYLLLSLGVVLAFYFSYRQTDQLRGQLCTLLYRSEQALPSNPYFKQHPEQLGRALNDVRQSLSDIGCN